jgi:hypothetical protein
MATDIVQGLFGLTPEAYQAEQNRQAQAEALRFAQLDPFQQANYGLYMGGRQLGGLVGQALGAQDPTLQRISQTQSLLRSIDPSDPKSLAAGIQAASQFNPQLALSLSDSLQKLQKNQADIFKSQRETLSTEQKNAAALADASGAERGSEAWSKEYSTALKGLTTKKPGEATLKAQAIVDARKAVRNTQEGTPERLQAEDMLRALQMDKYDITEIGVPGNPSLVQKVFVDKFDPTAKPIPFGGPMDRYTSKQNIGVSTVDKESNLRKDFNTETQDITKVISTAGRIEKLLNMGSLGETIAQKQFAKLAGDNNISNRDVEALSNFGDLGQRLAGTLSRFFEGTYSEAQRQEALKLVKELNASGRNQYSQKQQQYRGRAEAENLPAKTVSFIAPDLPSEVRPSAPLPPEGTKLRNKKTGKIEIVQGGKLVPVSE